MTGPTAYDLQRARQRDAAADLIELRRRDWHAARSARDIAWREAEAAVRVMLRAEAEYREAVAAYEAIK